ncbi:MAG: hypothetical protein Q9160_008803 [Pyrenula sp. 1 TL-2023]
MPTQSKHSKQSKATAPLTLGNPDTPPNSPTQAHGINVVTSDHIQQFLDILKRSVQGPPDSGPEPPPEKGEEKEKKIRASKIEYKTVNEVFVPCTSKWVFVELTDLVFSWNKSTYNKNLPEASFVDVKSTLLRDILRKVLKGVTCISLREDKPAVDRDVLFTYLPQLKEYRLQNTQSESAERLHLDKLIEFLEMHYASVSEKLRALLVHNEITFELLPVFFQPNTVIYTNCTISEQPRCLMFDSGQEKTVDGKKYFKLSCHCLTDDGNCFGEAAATAQISEFHGVMKITSLPVYPLQYHVAKREIVQKLTERGRKFISLRGTHFLAYKGMGVYNDKRGVRKFPVDGRVMVDAVSFREKNPNYFFPRVNEKPYGLSLDDIEISLSHTFNPDDDADGNENDVIKERISHTEQDLLLCKPTVFAFCLSSKQWAELAVTNLEAINWDSSAFSSLVMPEDKKEILQSLVERQTTGLDQRPFDDIIRGKGQSLVILLQYEFSFNFVCSYS